MHRLLLDTHSPLAHEHARDLAREADHARLARQAACCRSAGSPPGVRRWVPPFRRAR